MSSNTIVEINKRGRRPRSKSTSRSRSRSKSRDQKKNVSFPTVSSSNRATRRRLQREKKKLQKREDGEATKASSAQEKKAVTTIPKEIVSTISHTSSLTDVVAYQHFIECVMVDYIKRTDIAFSGYIVYYFYYLWFLFFIHHKRIGALTGTMASVLPDNVTGLNYAVPYPVAKYFEYISPYKVRCDIGPALNVSTGFFPAPAAGETGVTPITLVFPRGGTPGDPSPMIPSWVILNAVADQYQSVGGGFYNRIAGDVFYGVPGGGGATADSFTTWLSNDNNVQKYSTIFTKKGKTIPVGEVPITAPDLSAHARMNVVPGSTVDSYYLGMCGPTNEYSPELVPMFSVSSANTGQFSNTTMRSAVAPKFSPLGYGTPYTQIAFVFIWLMNGLDKYRKGSIYGVKVGGKRLQSLYPQPHYVDGYNLSKIAVAEYSQMMANKGNNTGDSLDPQFFNFTTMYTVFLSAFQRRLNNVEVLHECDLVTEFIAGEETYNFIVPQFTFADNLWSTASVPTQVAQLIESVGPVVKDGHLRVPFSNYQVKPTGRSLGGSTLGPFNWSVYGYTGAEMSYFGLPNPYTTGIINTTSTDVNSFPNLRVADTRDTSFGSFAIVALANISFYYGHVAFYPDPTAPTTKIDAIYPMLFNGTGAVTLLTTYRNFMGLNQTVNVSPLVVPANHRFGSSVTMLTTVTYDQFVGSKVTLEQTGYQDTPDFPAETVNNGNPTLNDIDTQSDSSELPKTKEEAIQTLGTTSQTNVSQAQSNDVTFISPLHKTLTSNNKPNPSGAPVDPVLQVAPYTYDPPLPSGSSTVHLALAALFSTPNSKIAKILMDRGEGEEGENPPLSHLVAKHAKSIANRAMDGLLTTNDPVAYYHAREGVAANDVVSARKPGKHHPLAGVVGGMFKLATGATKDVAKGQKDVVKMLGKDL